MGSLEDWHAGEMKPPCIATAIGYEPEYKVEYIRRLDTSMTERPEQTHVTVVYTDENGEPVTETITNEEFDARFEAAREQFKRRMIDGEFS